MRKLFLAESDLMVIISDLAQSAQLVKIWAKTLHTVARVLSDETHSG